MQADTKSGQIYSQKAEEKHTHSTLQSQNKNTYYIII